MKSVCLAVFVALFVVLCTAESKEKPTKLQIGIKKCIPADECTIKSRKGDTLSMHYTVRWVTVISSWNSGFA